MASLGQLPQIALTMVVVAAFFVAGFLVLDGLDDNITNGDALRSTGNVTQALSNSTTYLPTVGTLIGVSIILAVVIGSFVIGRRFM